MLTKQIKNKRGKLFLDSVHMQICGVKNNLPLV